MIGTETKSDQTNRGTVWREKVQQIQSAPFELHFTGIWKYKKRYICASLTTPKHKTCTDKRQRQCELMGKSTHLKKIKPDVT